MKQGSLTTVRLNQPLMSIALITITILLIAGTRQVQGGCSRFGHSCFGAHGKRADLPNSFEMGQSNTNYDVPLGYVQSPGYISLPTNLNTNNYRRISPYLIDWIMSAHGGEIKPQQSGNLKEDIQPLEMRRK